MRFLLLDRILKWNPGVSAVGIKSIALSEDFFEDHFPLKPIMPGALILEGMAQLSGLLIEEGVRQNEGRNVKALMSIVDRAKFRRPAYPGDTLTYTATVDSINEMGGRAAVRATCGDEAVADCTLIFSFHQIDNPKLDERRSEILALWLKGCAVDE